MSENEKCTGCGYLDVDEPTDETIEYTWLDLEIIGIKRPPEETEENRKNRFSFFRYNCYNSFTFIYARETTKRD